MYLFTPNANVLSLSRMPTIYAGPSTLHSVCARAAKTARVCVLAFNAHNAFHGILFMILMGFITHQSLPWVSFFCSSDSEISSRCSLVEYVCVRIDAMRHGWPGCRMCILPGTRRPFASGQEVAFIFNSSALQLGNIHLQPPTSFIFGAAHQLLFRHPF